MHTLKPLLYTLCITRVMAYPIQSELWSMPPQVIMFRFIMSVVLVLAGGFFAGLTLGLMGLDETNLQVMCESGSEDEKQNAKRVLTLLQRGKYWVLVTLLLSNVIVNETLPIVLDSIIGGGLLAVLISTALIVIFGEVIPQSICVRYGLAIGAKCSPIVLVIMYLMYPIAYPASYILAFFLGESKGTIYKKAGLKTLVSLHRSDENTDGLTEDEVTIIKSVLDLREKPVSQVMTPIKDVFTLPITAILDKSLVTKIVRNGYSRIPIKASEENDRFIGMLLVKSLISYDVDDQWPVSRFEINNLPETYPDTSCLDILNFFQEGKSHMAIVTHNPGKQGIPLGVITLEDVLESLIGEEIVDETDVFVDVQKKIKVKRMPSTRDTMPDLKHSSSSESKTGIKMRMKGYGAIVEQGTHSQSLEQEQNQQSNEPKI